MGAMNDAAAESLAHELVRAATAVEKSPHWLLAQYRNVAVRMVDEPERQRLSDDFVRIGEALDRLITTTGLPR